MVLGGAVAFNGLPVITIFRSEVRPGLCERFVGGLMSHWRPADQGNKEFGLHASYMTSYCEWDLQRLASADALLHDSSLSQFLGLVEF